MRTLATQAILLMAVGVSAMSSAAEPPRHVRLRSRDAKDDRPFSDAVRVGQTLYLAGRIGLDPATQKPPADAAAEVRNVMDQIKAVLAQEGMAMDDLVTVTVYCTDLSLYGTFNDVYRGYFTKGFPARAFIDVGAPGHHPRMHEQAAPRPLRDVQAQGVLERAQCFVERSRPGDSGSVVVDEVQPSEPRASAFTADDDGK